MQPAALGGRSVRPGGRMPRAGAGVYRRRRGALTRHGPYGKELSMGRPVTLFTAQWADLPLETLAALAANWGYDGLEVACMGDHLDPGRAANDLAYVAERLDLLSRHGLKVWAIGNPLAGQLVTDPNN